MEKIIETKICKCGTKFDITDKDLEFYDKVSPIFNGIKYSIPSPTLCPDCRNQRRLSFRNERNLYKRKCDLTGKDIISIYSPDKPYKVYEQSEWRSDKWEQMNYGKDFDFNRDFFEQFGLLSKEVPRLSIVSINSENSDYCSQGTNNKNCYLCSTTSYSEDCFYSNFIGESKDCIDSLKCIRSETNYFCINITGSNNVFYSINCNNCSDSYFLKDCNGCNSCFGCSNLTNAKYSIFNKEYTKDDYISKINELLKYLNKNYYIKGFKRENHNFNSENIIGDELINSKNSFYCFNGFNIEDCKFCSDVGLLNDSMDCNSFGFKCSLDYEVISGEEDYKNLFSVMTIQNIETMYCDNCFSIKNCFGCVGLRNKEYCILNKQYTKEEYEELVPKIIEHMKKNNEWGEFFSSSISPFGYNETVASEYFPLNKDEAIARGFKWSDYEAPFPKVDKTIPASKLPDDISDIPDDILNWAIECEVSKKPFRIIKQELEFYRKHGLPIPRRHPDIRHLDRMALRNPRKIFDRKCDKCNIDIKTTYSPDRPEIVYCEECYHKEVV